MNADQHAFFTRAQQRIARLEPDAAAAVLTAFRAIAASLTEAELAHLIASASADRILTVILAEALLERATFPIRAALRDIVERSFRWNVPYLPRGGKIDGEVAVLFDRLNPRVLDAMRELETSAVGGLEDGVRVSVRQALVRGLEAQQTPAAIARTVRGVIGLAPSQEAAVANFRALLEAGDRDALTRLLRDRRFDKTLDRALGTNGAGVSAPQIDRMVEAYRRKSVAMNAHTIASTATKAAYKVAQRESWQSAIDRGIVDGGALNKQWIGIGDARERPGHLAMNNTIVGFDEPYPNGDAYAGEHDPWNCRCLDRVFIGRR